LTTEVGSETRQAGPETTHIAVNVVGDLFNILPFTDV